MKSISPSTALKVTLVAIVSLGALYLFGQLRTRFRPLDQFEALARSLIGEPRTSAVPRLDAAFGSIEGSDAFDRKDFGQRDSKERLADEVRRMNWSPRPPVPENEEVICYTVMWNAVFVYIGSTGRVTRVVKSST